MSKSLNHKIHSYSLPSENDIKNREVMTTEGIKSDRNVNGTKGLEPKRGKILIAFLAGKPLGKWKIITTRRIFFVKAEDKPSAYKKAREKLEKGERIRFNIASDRTAIISCL